MGKSGRLVVLQVGIISVMLLGVSLCVHGLASSVPTYVVLPAPTATDNKEETRLGSRLTPGSWESCSGRIWTLVCSSGK